jgi:hypothetical protein
MRDTTPAVSRRVELFLQIEAARRANVVSIGYANKPGKQEQMN